MNNSGDRSAMIILRAARSRKPGRPTSVTGVGGERKSVENILGASKWSIVLFRVKVLEGGKWTWKMSGFSARAREAITLLLLAGAAVNMDDVEGVGVGGPPVVETTGVSVAIGEILSVQCAALLAVMNQVVCGDSARSGIQISEVAGCKKDSLPFRVHAC